VTGEETVVSGIGDLNLLMQGRANKFCNHNSKERLQDDNLQFCSDKRLEEMVTTRRRNENRRLRIGTWNVRTLKKVGKLENLKREVERYKMDVVGISEMRWTDEGDFWSEDYRIIYSGGTENCRGVGFIMNKEMGMRVKRIVRKNDRLMMMRIEN
jgi:hypothetical protein